MDDWGRIECISVNFSDGLSSPLYNKISIGKDKALLSANPFAAALLRSGILPLTKGNKFVPESTETSLYNTHNHDHEPEMIRARNSIIKFINLCYEFVSNNYPEIFERERYFIVSNRGTFAFIGLIGSLNAFESERGNLTPNTAALERFETIENYLNTLMTQLKKLPKTEEERLLNMLGSGTEIAWLRTFQSLVNSKYNEYEPSELTDWKERQDQELQDKDRKLGTDIEKYIKKTVIKTLKDLFGDNWDIEIGAIQRECETRATQETEKLYKEGLGRKNIPWTDMFFVSDYKKIIEKYWTKKADVAVSGFVCFDTVFSIDVGYGFNSKAEKIK